MRIRNPAFYYNSYIISRCDENIEVKVELPQFSDEPEVDIVDNCEELRNEVETLPKR